MTAPPTPAAGLDDLERMAKFFETEQDFDRVLVRYSACLMSERIRGRRVLECGSADGAMTGVLLDAAASLEVVEATEHYLSRLHEKFGDRLIAHRALVEEFSPERPFEVVVMGSLLHHLADPLQVLRRALNLVKPNGEILITVPNMTSFHRRLGVAMGVTTSFDAASARNLFYQQPGRFDHETLRALVETAGWRVLEISGFFIKPFPHSIMNQLDLPDALLDGLFLMGQQFPELAAQIFLHAKVPEDHERSHAP